MSFDVKHIITTYRARSSASIYLVMRALFRHKKRNEKKTKYRQKGIGYLGLLRRSLVKVNVSQVRKCHFHNKPATWKDRINPSKDELSFFFYKWENGMQGNEVFTLFNYLEPAHCTHFYIHFVHGCNVQINSPWLPFQKLMVNK